MPSAPLATRVAREPLRAVAQERIGVSEEHDRNRRVAAELGDELEHARERGADGERPLGRALQGRTVRHGIRERHAELDQIGVRRRRRRAGARGSSSRLGSPAMMNGTKPALPSAREPRERLADATHAVPVRALAETDAEVVGDRLHVLVAAAREIDQHDRARRGSVGAIRIAAAIACALSSAGMMPSCSASVRSAATAASSPIVS